ncbi:MAG: alpha/beta fold hydrolase [Pseudomonadota bacterium]
MTPHVIRRGDPDGAPVLLIHCALAHSGAWAGVMAGLRDHACTAFDLPGHGQSPGWDAARDYQAQCVAWAADLIDGPAHVVGHSFGGTVALRLAVEQPGKVARLTLIEPVYFAAVQGHDRAAFDAHEAAFAPIVADYQAGDMAAMAQKFTAMWGTGQRWEDIPTEARAALAAQMPLIVAQGAGITDDSGGVMNPGVLERVTCPVTLIRGAQTQAIVPAIHAALRARLPQAQEHVLEGAGHMSPMTHPRAVARLIRPE